jgi:hypothetical protein
MLLPKLLTQIDVRPGDSLKKSCSPFACFSAAALCLLLAGCARVSPVPSGGALSAAHPPPPTEPFPANGERESRELIVALHAPFNPADFARERQLRLVRVFRSDPQMAVLDAGSIEAARAVMNAFASDPMVRAVYFNPPSQNIRSSPR